MEKDALLRLVEQARQRAEGEDRNIAAQHEIISALERKGLDATRARELFNKLISARDLDIAAMERLLDELDQG